MRSYAASALAGALAGLPVGLLGGPAWAVYGIGYLAFSLFRFKDTVAECFTAEVGALRAIEKALR